MARAVDKSDQVTKGGWALGGIWSGCIIIGTVLAGTTQQFPYWWLLIILSIVSTALFVMYVIITKKILDNIDTEQNIKLLQILSIFQILFLNIPVFCYSLIGVMFYKRAFYTL
ncbi:hypothetical protein SCHIN_v1c05050 [Spiroplasma chinense]|uniref:Uncharacterized protein n=1 Tax=Spiroplasma chinense TaxID=216932 RepID=A0A5B9Y6J8_9MOLU|nr:hypothetical protein [Spiroplasma chinense]QEH61702.1 hypothetical protein SCHIN_v1c05050 [Spiroplasma chinense]